LPDQCQSASYAPDYSGHTGGVAPACRAASLLTDQVVLNTAVEVRGKSDAVNVRNVQQVLSAAAAAAE